MLFTLTLASDLAWFDTAFKPVNLHSIHPSQADSYRAQHGRWPLFGHRMEKHGDRSPKIPVLYCHGKLVKSPARITNDTSLQRPALEEWEQRKPT